MIEKGRQRQELLWRHFGKSWEDFDDWIRRRGLHRSSSCSGVANSARERTNLRNSLSFLAANCGVWRGITGQRQFHLGDAAAADVKQRRADRVLRDVACRLDDLLVGCVELNARDYVPSADAGHEGRLAGDAAAASTGVGPIAGIGTGRTVGGRIAGAGAGLTRLGTAHRVGESLEGLGAGTYLWLMAASLSALQSTLSRSLTAVSLWCGRAG